MNIALAGYGQEGEASYNYWKLRGANITIFDVKEPSRAMPENAKTYFAADAYSKMNDFDLVIRTPGLNPDKISTNSKIWSATNEFFANCPAEIIGVTGTKGKGTTASLIANILNGAGKKVHLLGNIGVPALGELPKIEPTDIVVFELSSFQLWDLEKSPQTAVVLMIEADHMDVHSSMAQYVEAKANIGKFQNTDGLLVFHPNNLYSAEVAAVSSAQKRRYMTPEGAYIISDVGVTATEAEESGQISQQARDDTASLSLLGAKPGRIVIEENVICSTSDVGLIGAHNLENVCAAITAAWNYTQDITAIKNSVTTFKGLPHRLEEVREHNGITYIDDSFSSAPAATMAAIASFTQPEILICGGFDRGLNYTQLAKKIAEQQNIKKVLLIGQTAEAIADSLNHENFTNYQIMKTNFEVIIHDAVETAEQGDVILLSPGCASFDMFKNFKERGEQFKKIVEEL